MEELNFDVHIASGRNYIRVNMHGTITTRNIAPVHLAMKDASTDSGIRKFLVDSRDAVNASPTVENYRFTREHNTSEFDFARDGYVVFLVRPDDTTHDTVIKLNPHYGRSIFLSHDEDSAIQWLLRQE